MCIENYKQVSTSRSEVQGREQKLMGLGRKQGQDLEGLYPRPGLVFSGPAEFQKGLEARA
jgi:hypothetical protein